MKPIAALLLVCGWIMFAAGTASAESCSVMAEKGSASCSITCPATEEDKSAGRNDAVCEVVGADYSEALDEEKSGVECYCR